MDLGLDDKGALIIGGGSDVGRETAVMLAREGARVVVAGRNRDSLDATVERIRSAGGEAHAAAVDLVDPAGAHKVVGAALDALGRIDLLANTAGPFPLRGMKPDFPAPIYADDEAWGEAFNGVFMSAVRLTREVMPLMQAQGSGAIVHLGANSARYYKPMTAQFAAMKAALVHAVKNWARDGATKGIRVNAVLPGWIKGDKIAARIDGVANDKGITQDEAERVMVGDHDGLFWMPRMGRPEEYAATIAFLLSPRASYINGALVPVDGGTAVW